MKKYIWIVGFIAAAFFFSAKNASAFSLIEFAYTFNVDTMVTGFIISQGENDIVSVSCPSQTKVRPGPGKRIEEGVTLANGQIAAAATEEEANEIAEEIKGRFRIFSGLAPCQGERKRCDIKGCTIEPL